MDLHSGAPFWLVRNGLPSESLPLLHDDACDVVVVGGGITGALVADALVASGADVVVLEQRLPGIGSTAASTALLQYEVDLELHDLMGRVGEAAAIRAYQLGVEALDRLEGLVAELGDPCGFARCGSIYLASRAWHVRRLRRECETRARAGLSVDWWDAKRVAETCGIPSLGAICSAAAAQIDALRLTQRLLDRVCRRGARLYARTTATSWTVDGHGERPVQVSTSRGRTVRARSVVLATGYDVPPGVDRSLVKLHSTYALATEPVEDALPWQGHYVVWESRRPYFYMRGTEDGRILAGGADVPFRDAAVRDALMPTKTAAMKRRLAEMVPDRTLEVSFAWAGTFAETPDGLPFIGATAESPRVLVALGYGGNGITYSVVASQILRDLCLGRPNEDAMLFRLDRNDRKQ